MTLHPDLAAIAAAHVPSARQAYCRECRLRWPCDSARLWTAYQASQEALGEAMEELREARGEIHTLIERTI